MYEALPDELRIGDHPEWSAWEKLLQNHESEQSWSIVSAGDLARIRFIPLRDALTKRQSELLLNTASCLGLSVEPDVRRGGKSYRWDQKLAIFRDDVDPVTEVDWHTFQSAAALLDLGIQVAAADNEISDDELKKITRHLERNFSLPSSLEKRLEARAYLLREFGTSDRSVAKSMRQRLTQPQRECVADFLIDVAAADLTITKQEDKLLRQICRTLAVSEEYLDTALNRAIPPVPLATAEPAHSFAVTSDDDADDEFVATEPEIPTFDLERLRRTREETRRVQQLLHEVLTEGDSENASSESHETNIVTAVSTTTEDLLSSVESISPDLTVSSVIDLAKNGMDNHDADCFEGLAPRFRIACKELFSRSSWGMNELHQLARTHGHMTSALLEAVNEWSMDRWGDWIAVEENDHVDINQTLLRNTI